MSEGELPTKESKCTSGAVLAARFNADGKYCLSCGKDRTLRFWNPHRGIHIKTHKGHGRDVHVTQDNAKLCSCGGDRQVFYRDVSTGRVIRKFRGHDSEMWYQRDMIDQFVHGIADLTALRPYREIVDDLGQPVNCISVSNDGNCVLASRICLSGRSTGELLQQYKVLQDYCCLTNTDAHVTGGSEDGFIFFWNLVDASVISRFQAHASVVTFLFG